MGNEHVPGNPQPVRSTTFVSAGKSQLYDNGTEANLDEFEGQN
jgi:hypothetical protein